MCNESEGLLTVWNHFPVSFTTTIVTMNTTGSDKWPRVKWKAAYDPYLHFLLGGKVGRQYEKRKKRCFSTSTFGCWRVKSCHTDLLFHNQFWTDPSCAHNGPAPEWGQTRPAPPPWGLQCLKTVATHNKHLSSLKMILNLHLCRLPERKTFLKVSVQLLVLL